MDAFQVFCDFEDGSCATCIDSKDWNAGPVDVSKESYWSLSNLFGKLRYAINKVQLKMLQITSHTAQQTVTIKCQNLQLGNHQPKFAGGFKKASLAPQVLSNGCDESSSSEATSVFSFSTSKPMQLPVTDVDMWLGGHGNEVMGVELGPVCFHRN